MKPAAVALAAAAAGGAKAKASTLRLVAHQDVFQFVDDPPSGDSAGDLVIASDKIYDRGGRRLLGRDHGRGSRPCPARRSPSPRRRSCGAANSPCRA